jgi:hypothetical protein
LFGTAITADNEADEKEKTQDDNTIILLDATTHTKQQRKKAKKVKPSHFSLHRILFENSPKKQTIRRTTPDKENKWTYCTHNNNISSLSRGVFLKTATLNKNKKKKRVERTME